jgi:GNAT superfamily N-acetyltransferase
MGTNLEQPASDVAATPPAHTYAWIPVRRLADRHRKRIARHLLALDEGDRYLRFGYAVSDAQIKAYVASLDFDHDEVFGIFNRRLQLIAMAHLAMPKRPEGSTDAAWAEFGVSVLRKGRGRGVGKRLFDLAALHARNRGIDTLYIQALSENAAMLKIARDAGAQVVREGPESQALLKLPPDNLATHMDEAVELQAAELDYQLKRQARRVDQFLRRLLAFRANIGKLRNTRSQ